MMDSKDDLENFRQEHELTPGGQTAPPETQEGDIPPGQEASFMNLKTLVVAGIGLFLLIIILSGLAGVLTAAFGRGQPAVEGSVRTPDPPNLQIAPQQDLESYQATQSAKLEGYGWVDEETGVVRIPIERAMELLAERGLPVEPRQAVPADTNDAGSSGLGATPTPESEAVP
jgi:hypothetical protein